VIPAVALSGVDEVMSDGSQSPRSDCYDSVNSNPGHTSPRRSAYSTACTFGVLPAEDDEIVNFWMKQCTACMSNDARDGIDEEKVKEGSFQIFLVW
jgi:hypothetical protein